MSNIQVNQQERERSQRRFCNDLYLKTLNNKIANIITLSAIGFIITDGACSPIMDESSQKLIDLLEKERQSYIESTYPELIQIV